MKIAGKKNLGFLVGLAALCASPVVLAWAGYPTGVVGQIDVAQGGGALGFRVQFSPSVPMCGNANGWAYLNTIDTNYSTNVAIVMMAKAQGLSITAYSNADANGYCHIGYLVQH
jgi:hypothetical protein